MGLTGADVTLTTELSVGSNAASPGAERPRAEDVHLKMRRNTSAGSLEIGGITEEACVVDQYVELTVGVDRGVDHARILVGHIALDARPPASTERDELTMTRTLAANGGCLTNATGRSCHQHDLEAFHDRAAVNSQKPVTSGVS
jgi:hypothetical protein